MENQEQPDMTPTQASTEPIMTIEPDNGNEEQKQKAIRSMRTRGIIGLIFGGSTILGLTVFAGIFKANAGSLGGALFSFLAFMAYCGLTMLAIPVTVILLIVNISEKKKFNLPFTTYLGMSIAGVVLAFAPYLVAETWVQITSLTKKANPYVATGSTTSISKCENAATRARFSSASKDVVAEDILCSYLEYSYENQATPSNGEQVKLQMKKSNFRVTIDADQPESEDAYNIVTHRSCSKNSSNDNSAISVWYLDKNNKLSCTAMKAHIDLYQMPPTEGWYEELFYPNDDSEDEE